MASRLKARAPEANGLTRPKILVFGPPNSGKTWQALDFPAAYYIDTEGGASLPHYQEKLKASGGVYFGRDQGSLDFNTVIEEVSALATVKHDYLWLIIDSFSKLYLTAAAQAEEHGGSEYGRDRKEANKPTRRLLLWLERLDMNVLLICHEKTKWERQGQNLVSLGATFDGMDKLEYDLHLALHVTRNGARVTKTRLEGFPRDAKFPWSFEELEKRTGRQLVMRPAQPVDLATPDQVSEVKRLLGLVRMEDGWEDKVFAKAGVTGWDEMDTDKCQACIEKLTERIHAKGLSREPVTEGTL